MSRAVFYIMCMVIALPFCVSASAQTLPPGFTLTCYFTMGPRAGTTFDFTGFPGVTPEQVGTPCGDGIASLGIAVAPQILSSPPAPVYPLQIIGNGPLGPICNGPLGPGLCSVVLQYIQQHPQGYILPPQTPQFYQAQTFSALGNSAKDIGLDCAQQSNGNINAFIACTGQQVILPEDQQIMIDCASRSGGTFDGFMSCSGQALLGKNSNEDQQIIVDCAGHSGGTAEGFALCAGQSLLEKKLGPTQQVAVDCAISSTGDVDRFFSCAGAAVVDKNLNQTQKLLLNCALNSGGSPDDVASCAGRSVLDKYLNADQQIVVQCVVETGGAPWAAAGCAATRLTVKELTKCIDNGIGGSKGCFGDNNDLTGKNGWTVRSFNNIVKDIQHGPGPNNDLVGKNGFVVRSVNNIVNDIHNGPKKNNDLVGCNGWVNKKIFGRHC